jgi:hypothetical protein
VRVDTGCDGVATEGGMGVIWVMTPVDEHPDRLVDRRQFVQSSQLRSQRFGWKIGVDYDDAVFVAVAVAPVIILTLNMLHSIEWIVGQVRAGPSQPGRRV